jgi:hypothetical protein
MIQKGKPVSQAIVGVKHLWLKDKWANPLARYARTTKWKKNSHFRIIPLLEAAVLTKMFQGTIPAIHAVSAYRESIQVELLAAPVRDGCARTYTWVGRRELAREWRVEMVTSVPRSRDAPRRETNHRYFKFKRLYKTIGKFDALAESVILYALLNTS